MSSGCNIDSIRATIKSRRGRAIASIYEIKAVLEDIRIGAVGGLMGGLDLWELAVIPMLLYNSETWNEIDEEVIKELDDIQNQFLRVMFEVPTSTPKPILSWDTATIGIQNKIDARKLKLAIHLQK